MAFETWWWSDQQSCVKMLQNLEILCKKKVLFDPTTHILLFFAYRFNEAGRNFEDKTRELHPLPGVVGTVCAVPLEPT
jgi:hypothetical protein